MANFSTNDFPTLAALSAENANSEQVDFRLDQDISGEVITGFDNGLRIYTDNGSKITGDLSFNTITEAILEGVTAENVLGNVHCIGCSVDDVDTYIASLNGLLPAGTDTVVNISASIGTHAHLDDVLTVFEPMIQSKFGRTITYFNEGVPGTNLQELLDGLPAVLDKYQNQPNTVFVMHILGGDHYIGEYDNLSQSSKDVLYNNLSSVYDLVHANGNKLIQGSLTFRNTIGANGEYIINDPVQQALAIEGTYDWTRDLIVPVMQVKAPEFLKNDWPILDYYNISRNGYKQWFDPRDPLDVTHAGLLARGFYLWHEINVINNLIDGLEPPVVTPRNFDIPFPEAVSPPEIVFGFGRTTEVGDLVAAEAHAINWTVRSRPPVAGTEPVYIDSVKDVDGNIVNGVKLYSYFDYATRNGEGNTEEPTNDTASLENNTLLMSALGSKLNSIGLYVIIEGLQPNSLYGLSLAFVSGSTSNYTNTYYSMTETSDGVTINGSDLPAKDNVGYMTVRTDDQGTLFVNGLDDSVYGSYLSGLKIGPVQNSLNETINNLALLTTSYTQATFDPVAVGTDDTIKFTVTGLDASTGSVRFLGSTSDSSGLYYIGSTGRLRFTNNLGENKTFSGVTALNDGGTYELEFRFLTDTCEFYIDGVLEQTYTSNMGDYTFDIVSEYSASATVTTHALYNFEILNTLKFSMLSDDAYNVNVTDSIGSRTLTYVDLSMPLTAANFVEI